MARKRYSYTLQKLISALTQLRDLDGVDPETPVMLAIQPGWPFEHGIGSVDVVDLSIPNDDDDDDDDDDDKAGKVVYIGEESQHGYLPSTAARQIGW